MEQTAYNDLCKSFTESLVKERQWELALRKQPQHFVGALIQTLGINNDTQITTPVGQMPAVFAYGLEEPDTIVNGAFLDSQFIQHDGVGIFGVAVLLRAVSTTATVRRFNFALCVRAERRKFEFGFWDEDEGPITPLFELHTTVGSLVFKL